ncbi:MAG TPA: LysE family transporter [Ginsengibacter sp.]|nr:LysE family transporter [Chitinophagaceae bacterium]MCZ2395031.1 LysE family translocator [Chitinophagales bacterium]HRN73201.1 LysE family transporter [Ginsengibacter sp.]HRP45167.1 LysE family transporter [Ginsengibacter sp.]
MPSLFRVFIWGLIVSFIGSLPLGTLNVAAMQISIQESVMHAIYFSLGSLTVEMIYVRFSLIGIDWIRKQKKLFRWMEWITVAIVFALAIGSFAAAMMPHQEKNVMLDNHIHRYLLGLMLSAINPVQIPFWFGWSTVLFTKNILKPQGSFYNLYIVGIGLGTFLGNLVFIFGGRVVADKLNTNQNMINWVIGGIFTITAIIFLIKIFMKKDAAEGLKDMGVS